METVGTTGQIGLLLRGRFRFIGDQGTSVKWENKRKLVN